MINRAVERAQSQVESQNFEIRKNVLKYDEVMNRQREVIYSWRSGILHGGATTELVNEWIEKVIEDTVVSAIGEESSPGSWDWEALNTEINIFFPIEISPESVEGRLSVDGVVDAMLETAHRRYEEREEELGSEVLRQIEPQVMLQIIDAKWREHLADMDYLRAGIGLRAMGQRDPLTEYQREAFDMFQDLVEAVKRDAVRYLYHVQVTQKPAAQPQQVTDSGPKTPPKQVVNTDKVGRNEPCPCGSGKKYKRCHGAATG
jgi:preprotein translocase subunit SecA